MSIITLHSLVCWILPPLNFPCPLLISLWIYPSFKVTAKWLKVVNELHLEMNCDKKFKIFTYLLSRLLDSLINWRRVNKKKRLRPYIFVSLVYLILWIVLLSIGYHHNHIIWSIMNHGQINLKEWVVIGLTFIEINCEFFIFIVHVITSFDILFDLMSLTIY